ncbi:SURF1 family protein, partial [Streptomyces goshikiensis]
QWWLFAAAVPVGWVILVRRDLRDRREAAAEEAASGAGGDGGTPEQEPATVGG